MFKQYFDNTSSTLTYLIVDDATKEAALIDPVDSHIDFYLSEVKRHGIRLKFALETHVHADHITASGQLRKQLGLLTAVSQQCGAETADIQLNDGDQLLLGGQKIHIIATPGHTAGSLSFLWQDKAFTGDTLLINGCGRTDFQSGDAGKLYDSVTQKLFTLANETLVYPGHDYNGKRVSNIAQEKGSNQRFLDKSKIDFITMMRNLNLPKPKMIDVAVPANQKCGVDESDVLQG